MHIDKLEKLYNIIKTVEDRMKEVTFRRDGKNYIMQHKGQDLAMYIGDLPFEEAKRFFEPPILPKWQLDKKVKSDIQIRKLKISNHLPSQCGMEGEVLNGKDFLVHCQIEHKGWVPKMSLINASPYRYWLLWYSDLNFLKFMEDRGEIQYVKANPPWINQSCLS